MYKQHDLKLLQDIYNRDSNDIALLYGSKDTGLEQILFDLIKDKECLYYKATAVDDRTQRQLLSGEIHDQTKSPILPDEDYTRLISTYINNGKQGKKILVLDDFSYIIKENPTFINFLIQLLYKECAQGSAMFLLVSDDIRWVENDMLKLIGKKSSEISAVVKLSGYSASEFVRCFPQMPLREAIGIYSVIGGKCAYYNDITDDTTLKSVVIRELNKLYDTDADPNAFLPDDIREPAYYNTILVQIAAGVEKLNDLHNITGIDRAKLSVYIKTLIENGLVEKAVSADVGNAKHTRKGIYRISNMTAGFYYRFVFPHLSSLHVLGFDRFYRRYIEHDIHDFIENLYPRFCMEHIRWLEREGRLTFKIASVEEYFDKNEAIDFVIVAVGGSVIACSCRYSGPHMSYDAYEKARASVRRNKILCDNIWLFSASGFDQKLSMFGTITPGVRLIEGKDQRLR